MNRSERIKMVKAMEYIVRQVNDESLVIDYWLSLGVADGDIPYGDLEVREDDDEYYIEDDNFKDLMRVFVNIMSKCKNGGLYCDGVVSN